LRSSRVRLNAACMAATRSTNTSGGAPTFAFVPGPVRCGDTTPTPVTTPGLGTLGS
jgi:hypothetical protein